MHPQTKKAITVVDAKLLVNLRVKEKLGLDSGEFVQENYLSANNCWMFYLVKSPEVMRHRDLHGRAYVVSKSGEILSVADFSFDKDIANDFLDFTSVYFETGVRDKNIWDDIVKRSKEKNWGKKE